MKRKVFVCLIVLVMSTIAYGIQAKELERSEAELAAPTLMTQHATSETFGHINGEQFAVYFTV